MSSTEPPAGAPNEPWASSGTSYPGFGEGSGAGPAYVPVTPLLPDDPPKVGEFWLDARIGATPAGIAFTAHDPANTPAMVILLAEGAAADAAARARFAGEINGLHIDMVLARGGHGQDTGRLGRKYRSAEEDPVAPDDRLVAPWAALAYDGSPAAAAQAMQILDAVQIATLPPQGVALRPRLPAVLDRPGASGPGAPLATAVARPFRPGRLANDLGVLAPHAAACGTGRAHRDLDLPQSTTTVAAAANGQFRRAHSQGPRSQATRNRGLRSRPGSGSPSSGSPGPSGTESGGGEPTESATGSPAASNSPRSRL